MAADDDDDRPGLPALLYLIVGVLAVIGLISISGFIFGAIAFLIRTAVILLVAVVAFWILKAIFFGRSSRPTADSDL